MKFYSPISPSLFLLLLLTFKLLQRLPLLMNDCINFIHEGFASPTIETGRPSNQIQKAKHKNIDSGVRPPVHLVTHLGHQIPNCNALTSDNNFNQLFKSTFSEESRVPLHTRVQLNQENLDTKPKCVCVALDASSTYPADNSYFSTRKGREACVINSNKYQSQASSNICNKMKSSEVFKKATMARTDSGCTKIPGCFCFIYCPKLYFIVVLLLLAGCSVKASEFPGRECCDSVPPPPPNYHHSISTTTSTTQPPNSNFSSVSHYGESQINCIQAREQCLGEARCREALAIFKQVCGPELAACSTVTQTKCRRVLRTLQSYDYLVDCKCAEPHVDYVCHTFRGTIFSHPCDSINPNEKESLMVLPTCNQALKQCRSETSCFKDYTEFLKYCSFDSSGNRCESVNLNKCHKSWVKVRQSHVFGCICPPDPHPLAIGPSIYYDSPGYGRPEDKLSMIRDLTQSDQNNNNCLKTYNETHRNPCLTPQGHSKDIQIEEVQQTCHRALKSCQNDNRECQPLLNDVMMWCEHTHCEPDRCRAALQNFYSRVNIGRRLEVAFCVCRQNDPDGECLTAMRKLHPTCAQRQAGREEKKCHEIAQQCRRSHNCRSRLEEYEQNCSADVMTGKCSGTHRACQFAVTKILGTELHASCVCKGTDFLHQRDCYTWQKLLWSNPCVIESHLALQEELRKGENLDDIFTKAPISTTTPTPPRIPSTAGNMNNPYGSYGTMMYSPNGQIPPRGNPFGSDHGSSPPSGSSGPIFGGGRGRGNGGGGVIFGGGRGRSPGTSFGGRGKNHNCKPGDSQCQSKPSSSWRGRQPIGNPDFEVRHRGRDNGVPFGGNRKNERNPSNGNLRPHQVGKGNMVNGRNNFNGRVGHRGNNGLPITPMGPMDANRRGHGPYLEGGNRFGMPPHPDASDAIGSRMPYYQNPKEYPPQFNDPNVIPPPHNENREQSQYDLIPTTTETTTTTIPPRYCILQGTSQENEVENIKIAEGTWKRIYKADCSSLCQCPKVDPTEDLSQARCHTLGCIPHKGCNTTEVHYPHSSPFYQRYRGVCICYYGNFICQRPDPEESKVSLGPGIYLLLGYSKNEMELLKHHTRTNELEALAEIEKLLIRKYGFKCRLITKEQVGENLIVLSELRLNDDTYMNPTVKQKKEKEQCTEPLRELADKINARPRHPDVTGDAYLSMFIVAELHVNMPEAHTSPSAATGIASPLWLFFFSLGLFLVLALENQQSLDGLASLKLFSLRIPKYTQSDDSKSQHYGNNIADET